jgi:hypothetical protein
MYIPYNRTPWLRAVLMYVMAWIKTESLLLVDLGNKRRDTYIHIYVYVSVINLISKHLNSLKAYFLIFTITIVKS